MELKQERASWINRGQLGRIVEQILFISYSRCYIWNQNITYLIVLCIYTEQCFFFSNVIYKHAVFSISKYLKFNCTWWSCEYHDRNGIRTCELQIGMPLESIFTRNMDHLFPWVIQYLSSQCGSKWIMEIGFYKSALSVAAMTNSPMVYLAYKKGENMWKQFCIWVRWIQILQIRLKSTDTVAFESGAFPYCSV